MQASKYIYWAEPYASFFFSLLNVSLPHTLLPSSVNMPFFPLFYVKLEPSAKLGTLHEGLYVMTHQSNTTDVGVLIGLNIALDRQAQLVLVPEHARPRTHPFPDRQFLGNIQLASPQQLSEWFSTRHQPANLIGTAPNSIEELSVARQWFADVAHDLRGLKI